MIFDSQRIETLRDRFAHLPVFYTPQIIALDRNSKLSGERDYLERLTSIAPAEIQRRWLGALISTQDGHHLGAWFEIMLYGWLCDIGRVEIEPGIEGDLPDFMLKSNDQEELFIEAKSWLIADDERYFEKRQAELLHTLHQVKLPYLIEVTTFQPRGRLQVPAIMSAVTDWLVDLKSREFEFTDDSGNHVRLCVGQRTALEHVMAVGSGETRWVNPHPLRVTLKKKAAQHKRLRQAQHRYLLAIYMESPFYSAEDVADAWFGNPSVTIDKNTLEVVGQGLDGTGLHYFGGTVLHRSVSGTLIFKSHYDEEKQRRELVAWYVQNPYARRAVDPDIFPLQSMLVAVEGSDGSYRMQWRNTIG